MSVKKFFKKNIFLVLLVLIGIFSHQEWFNLNSILVSGDWKYWPTETMRDYISSFNSWIGDRHLGYPNIQIYFNVFHAIWSLGVIFGLTTEQISKINLFIPVALLGFISPYLLVNKFVKEKFISFTSALFYGTTTYFLILQTSHMTIAFVYSITPLILLAFISALEKNKIFNWLIFVLLFSIGIGYELRIMYIVSFILLSYFIFFYFNKIKYYLKNIFIFCLLTFLLNIYWIAPTLLGSAVERITQVTGRDLFGDFLTNIMRGFSLSHWSWTGVYKNRDFEPQSILLYFWLLPIFVFSTFLIKRNKYLKQMLYFLILLLVGIFLIKQSAPPFPDVYLFFYKYLPGFKLFRESSKLYLLISFSYALLLAFGLSLIKEKSRKFFYSIASVFIIISFINLVPLINKEFRTLFVAREMPHEYKQYENYIINDKNSYRTLWIPRNSVWSFYSVANPRVHMAWMIGQNWTNFFINANNYITEGQRIVNFLNEKNTQNLLNISSIRYIAIPLQDFSDLENKLFESSGTNREFYINELKKVNYLDEANLGIENLKIFENKSYKPRVYYTIEKETISSNISYSEVDYKINSAARYSIFLKNIKNPIYLNFSEAYSRDWVIRIGDFSWYKGLISDTYFIKSTNHFKNDAGLNSFYIDPQNICTKYQCQLNQDGSYNINVTIFFKAQSYFYIGLIISISTLILIIGSFLGLSMKRINNIIKNEKKHN